ncbi:VaFE repeat-containing surface-anchored protein [uncultured Secundilactobacillus sp.]|uniref:VaFE repeat-containing surface-anchored protein n=1 Tax=uncultured Secundilactobacillus sp. TaxID=2813935 RepID=UPI002584A396|nr:VaFE repeat-containing surface-anchored protein [uncultured Secundilactobacillus sp.]
MDKVATKLKVKKQKRRNRRFAMLSLATMMMGTLATAGSAFTETADAAQIQMPGVTKTKGTTLPKSFHGFKTAIPTSKFPVYGKVGSEPLIHEDFVTSSGYQAWCLNYNQYSPNASSTTGSMKSLTALEFHVLLNGYPFRTAKELGVKSQLQALATTQYALWVAAGNFSYDSITWSAKGAAAWGGVATSDENRNTVRKAVKALLTKARADKRSQTAPKLSFTKFSSKTNGDGSKTYYYKPAVSGNWTTKSATISAVSLPSGGKLEQDGKELKKGSTFNFTKSIQMTLPKGDKAEKASFSGEATVDSFFAGGRYNIPGVQDAAVTSATYDNAKVLKASASASSTPTVEPTPETEGSLKIHKVGEKDEPLKDIKFDLLDENKKVIQSGVTDESGLVEFKNLKAGLYYYREASSDQEHDLDPVSYPVEIDGDTEVTVKNVPKRDTPIIRSFTTETETGSRLVDAKKTNLTDQVVFDNLDEGHDYIAEDTLYDRETKQPVMVDGKPVTGSVSFTGDHSGHDVESIPLKADFTGQQAKKYVTIVKVYRADDKKLLAQEDSFNDTNQGIEVLKPKLITTATSNDLKVANPYSKTKVKDHVQAVGLVKNHKYTVHLHEMVKNADGSVEPLKNNGKEVVAEKTFTADYYEDEFDVDFPEFDTRDIKGKDIVIYSEITPDDDPANALGSEHNAKDAGETIRITNPQLQTQALIDDDSLSNPYKASLLKDRVTYTDLAPNTPVELSAIMADKNKRAVVVNKDKKNYLLMGKVTVTPASDTDTVDVPLEMVNTPDAYNKLDNGDKTKQDENGNVVDVSDAALRQTLNTLKPIQVGDFNIDAEKAGQTAGGSDLKNPYLIDTRTLAGKSMTAFEDLTEQPDQPMASHADVNSKEQTVNITNPKIHTKALLNDHKVSNPNSKSHLKDVVSYEGVAPDHEFDLSALAVDPTSGKRITLNDGKKGSFNLMGRTTVMPKAAKGEATVPLQQVKAVDDNENTTNGATTNGAASDDSAKADAAAKQTTAWSSIETPESTIKIDSTGTDKQISDAAKLMLDLAKSYGVDASDFNKTLTSVSDPMTNDQKLKLVEQFKNLSAKIKDQRDQAVNETHKEISIHSTDSDQQIKQAATDIETWAKELGVDTKALEKAVSDAHDPMTNDDKKEIVRQWSTVSDAINAAQKQDIKTDDTVKEEPRVYEDTQITQSAEKRVHDNTIQAQNPLFDDTPIDPKSATYDIDTTLLRGQKMVMLEDMSSMDDADSPSKTVITSEVDKTNKDQQVRVTSPKIQTLQTIKNLKTLDGVTQKEPLADTVSFTDLAPNEKVTLTAAEMDKGTKQAVRLNGQYLDGRKTFTPTTSDGKVTVNLNPFNDAPSARYMVQMLDDKGLLHNTSIKEATDSTQNSDNNAAALDRDETDTADDGRGATDNDSRQSTNGGQDTDSVAKDQDSSSLSEKDKQAIAEGTGNSDNYDNKDYNGQAGAELGTDNVDQHEDTSVYDLNLETITTPQTWTAFESLENPNGDMIAEHKDINSADQTVTINPKPKSPTPPTTPGEGGHNENNGKLKIKNKNSNQGSNKSDNKNKTGNASGGNATGSNNTNNVNVGGGSGSGGPNSTNGSNGNNGSGSNGGIQTGSGQGVGAGATGKNIAPVNSNASPASPQLAQTGASDKVSHNGFYNFLYHLFH